MPAVGRAGSGAPGQRTVFRPPWVKDGNEVTPPPPPTGPPWRRQSRATASEESPDCVPAKNSIPGDKKVKVIPAAEGTAEMKQPAAPPRDGIVIPVQISNVNAGKADEKKTKVIPIKRVDETPRRAESRDGPLKGRRSMEGMENGFASKNLQSVAPPAPPPPAPPPAPPKVPAPPPMPSAERAGVNQEKKMKLDALRSRPRRRPDWAEMMKEVEAGKKLKHVQCNDRSRPLLPQVKAKGQFVYETEQKNIHNLLLNQIQEGVKLKKTVTNDRSKPILEGLRKFRRQLTIEEQIQVAEEERVVEPDELDDIDKVRDDLQSTKQMLALELQNKTQLEREARLLQAKVYALEEQLEKERERARRAEEERDRIKEATDCGIPGVGGDPLDSLRAQVALAGKTAYGYQQKYQDTCRKLELTRATLEDEEHKNLLLEKKLETFTKGGGEGGVQTISVQTDPVVVVGSEVIPLTKQTSRKEIARAVVAAAAQQLPKQHDGRKNDEDEESEYTEESCSEDEESESDGGKEERRHQREMKMLASKLKSYREKEGMAKKERKALREQYGRLTKTLKTEKKKYKKLQKEVDKMAKVMKDEDEGPEEEEEEEEETSEEEEEEETSEEEEEEEEEDGIPEDDPKAPPEKKTFRFEQMIKKHENSLGALKKGNYMLKANIDRLKDELEKQKEMYVTLQEDLNSVLAELG